MSETPTFTDVRKRIHAEIIPKIQGLRFDAGIWEDLLPMLNALGLLETVEAACIVGEADLPLQVDILLRSALEQFVNLRLSCRRDIWLDHLLLEDAENWLAVLKRSKAGNPFFASIGDLNDLDNHIKEKEREIEGLKAKGAAYKSPERRFKDADMRYEHQGLYKMLSNAAHGSLTALKSRHTDINDGEIEVSAFHGPGPTNSEAARGTLDELLGLSLDVIETRFSNSGARKASEAAH